MRHREIFSRVDVPRHVPCDVKHSTASAASLVCCGSLCKGTQRTLWITLNWNCVQQTIRIRNCTRSTVCFYRVPYQPERHVLPERTLRTKKPKVPPYMRQTRSPEFCTVGERWISFRLSELDLYLGNFSDFSVERTSFKLPAGVLACAHKVLLNKGGGRAASCNTRVVSVGLIAVSMFLWRAAAQNTFHNWSVYCSLPIFMRMGSSSFRSNRHCSSITPLWRSAF